LSHSGERGQEGYRERRYPGSVRAKGTRGGKTSLENAPGKEKKISSKALHGRKEIDGTMGLGVGPTEGRVVVRYQIWGSILLNFTRSRKIPASTLGEERIAAPWLGKTTKPYKQHYS